MAAKKKVNAPLKPKRYEPKDDVTDMAHLLACAIHAYCGQGTEDDWEDKEVAKRAMLLLHARELSHVAEFFTQLHGDAEYQECARGLSQMPDWARCEARIFEPALFFYQPDE